ncbi:MAG: hypothetical protein IT285_02160, partial [Bdellovibrionales bacterium]|nr:hypothetical protein [Bdellovibrionales bacterium]
SNQRVVGYALESLATGMSATVVVGQTSMTSSNLGLDAQGLTFPRSVAVDTERLIVIDSGNERALGYSADSLELPPPVAADTPYGDIDLNGPGGATCLANELSTPLGAVVAGTRLLVADSLNHRVSVWNDYINQGAGASADLFLGQTNGVTCSVPGAPAANLLMAPEGVWSDGTRVAVVDTDHYRVLIWNSFPMVSGQAADLVLGQQDMNSAVLDDGAWGMEFPSAVTSDGTVLAVADKDNNRVMIWHSWPTQNFQEPDVVLGQAALDATLTAPDDDSGDGITDGAPSARTMDAPTGVLLHGDLLFVAERDNNRVLVFRGTRR